MIWVQSILFFILGITLSSFLVILVFPLIWRRALFLANKAVRMELPISLNEVAVERDFLRAEHATQIARLEELLKIAEDRYANVLLEISQIRERNHYLLPFEQTTKELTTLNTRLGREIIFIKQELNEAKSKLLQQDSLQEKIAILEEKNQNALSSIKKLRNNLTNYNKNDILRINSSDGHNNSNYNNLLEAEIYYLSEDSLTLHTAHQQALNVLREQIKTMAAILVANVAIKEGKESPLAELLTQDEGADSLASLIKTNMSYMASKTA